MQPFAYDYHTVEARNNDKEGGSQPRAIYSQRHLSPHRMMHFGKRPIVVDPPMIATPIGPSPAYMTPRGFDLYESQSSRYPYLFSIELERGQTLRALPEGKLKLRN